MPASETLRSRANPLYKRLRALKHKGAAARPVPASKDRSSRSRRSAPGSRSSRPPRPRGPRRHSRANERSRRCASAACPSGAWPGARRLALRGRDVPGAARAREAPGVRARAGADAGRRSCCVIDGVQNPGNLGALLRSAEAAGASGALLTTGSADPLSWKALRGSMGSAFRLPHVSGLSLDDAARDARSARCPVLATASDGERRYDEADLRGPVAIVVGREGSGLAAAVKQRAVARLAHPARGSGREPQRGCRDGARAVRSRPPAWLRGGPR